MRTSASNLTARMGIVIAILVIVTVVGFKTVQSYENRKWNHSGNFAILDTDKLSVTVYVPDREAVYTFLLPGDAYVNVPGGYGTYQIQNAAELSYVEKKDSSLLERAITTGVGIPVTITTNELTVWDRIRMYLAGSNYAGNIETLDLSDEPIFVREKQPDGEEILVVAPDKLATLTAELLWERSIIDERLAVGVFNASATPGLAANITHMLETMGVHVVDTTNWEGDPTEGTCVFRALESVRESVTLSRLQAVLSCRTEYVKERNGRFDIQVILNDLPL